MTSISLLDNNIIPFPNAFVYYSAYFSSGLTLIGTVNNLFLLVTNIGKQNTASSVLILSLCIADLMFCMAVLFTYPIIIHNNGFSFGSIGCIIDNAILVIPAILSIITITSIAVERYLTVVRGKTITVRQATLWALVCWSLGIMVIVGPIVGKQAENMIVLEANSLFCIVNWTSQHPTIRCLNVFIITCGIVCCCLILFSYTSVYIHASRASRASYRKQASTLQKKVFIKCLVLTVCFFCFWVPELINMIGSVVAGIGHSAENASVSGTLIAVNCTLNPILLYHLDPRIRYNMRQSLKKLFGKDQEDVPEPVEEEEEEIQTEDTTIKLKVINARLKSAFKVSSSSDLLL